MLLSTEEKLNKNLTNVWYKTGNQLESHQRSYMLRDPTAFQRDPTLMSSIMNIMDREGR